VATASITPEQDASQASENSKCLSRNPGQSLWRRGIAEKNSATRTALGKSGKWRSGPGEKVRALKIALKSHPNLDQY
jgi:hypothetical protein